MDARTPDGLTGMHARPKVDARWTPPALFGDTGTFSDTASSRLPNLETHFGTFTDTATGAPMTRVPPTPNLETHFGTFPDTGTGAQMSRLPATPNLETQIGTFSDTHTSALMSRLPNLETHFGRFSDTGTGSPMTRVPPTPDLVTQVGKPSDKGTGAANARLRDRLREARGDAHELATFPEAGRTMSRPLSEPPPNASILFATGDPTIGVAGGPGLFTHDV